MLGASDPLRWLLVKYVLPPLAGLGNNVSALHKNYVTIQGFPGRKQRPADPLGNVSGGTVRRKGATALFPRPSREDRRHCDFVKISNSLLNPAVGLLNLPDDLQVLNLLLRRVLVCRQKVISLFCFLSPKTPPSNYGEMTRKNMQFRVIPKQSYNRETGTGLWVTKKYLLTPVSGKMGKVRRVRASP